MKIDLHAHTRHSDGMFTPTALIEEAATRGVAVQAVTDHDSVAALAEAREAGKRLGVQVVTGVEFSTRDAVGDVHVLAFFPSDPPASFLALLEKQQAQRQWRAARILERLAELNMPVTWEDLRAAGADERSVGRPHVARALLARGFVSSFPEAFKRWLAPGRPAYVKHDVPQPEEAVRAVLEAGGVPVVAHPGHLKDPTTLDRMIAAGLKGVETFHPDHRPDQVAQFASLALKRDLIPTGGSDFHGLTGQRFAKLGDYPTPPEAFARIEALWGNPE